MSVQTEIDRIISAVEAAHNKILEKGGTTERPYTVAGLEQAIDTIPNAVVKPLEITENGTYTAPDGVDGYSPVTVNVAASGGVEWIDVRSFPTTYLDQPGSSSTKYYIPVESGCFILRWNYYGDIYYLCAGKWLTGWKVGSGSITTYELALITDDDGTEYMCVTDYGMSSGDILECCWL